MTVTQTQFNDRLPGILPSLRAFVVSKMDDVNDAEDVLQETLVRAYTSLANLRSVDEALPWLLTLARFEVRTHFLYQKRDRRTALNEEIGPSSPDQPANLLSEFDRVMDLLCSTGCNRTELVCAALHLFTQHTRREIAGYLSLSHGIVSRHIRKVKQRLGEKKKAPDPVLVVALKKKMQWMMCEAGMDPNSGPVARNMDLWRLGVDLMRSFYLQRPDDADLALNLCQNLYNLSKAEELNQSGVPVKVFYQCDRKKWDAAPKREADALYKSVLSKSGDLRDRLIGEYQYLLHHPARYDDVDWKRALHCITTILKKYPRSRLHWYTATCYFGLYGPLTAAQYLDEHKRNKALCGESETYFRLGFYYYAAGKPEKARAHFNAMLKFSLNDPVRAYIQKIIHACSENSAH